jgi:hypothetical protein
MGCQSFRETSLQLGYIKSLLQNLSMEREVALQALGLGGLL